jgi:hypothetical protein
MKASDIKVRHPGYMNMTVDKLHDTLERMRTGTNNAQIVAIKKAVQEDKAALRSAKRSLTNTKNQHRSQWIAVTLALNTELRRVQGSLNYPEPTTPERVDALEAYAAVMTQLKDRLAAMATVDGLPAQTPKDAAVERGIPNEGVHWTDWVPERIKARVRLAFEAIPYKPKAKVKEPFLRTIPPVQHGRLKEQLRSKTTSLLLLAQRTYNVKYKKTTENLEPLVESIEAMQAALRALDRLPLTAPIPRDWRKLTVKEEDV